MVDNPHSSPESGPLNGLTSIPRRIHCAATQDIHQEIEIERLKVEEFLKTLAEIALSIARRKPNKNTKQD